jgi:glycosyltransferase involved in cell wall biosynthesis
LRRSVVITWDVSSYHGWGVYGLNLALHWARDPDLKLTCGHAVRPETLSVDPLTAQLLGPFIRDSAQLAQSCAANPGGSAQSSGPVLLSLDDEGVATRAAHDVALTGKPNVGVCFFVTAEFSAAVRARLQALDLVVSGCRWNAELLRANGVERVVNILQGIDPTLFHPAPRHGLLGDRFLVFSGGKLERRKGQDIVVAAFKLFAERHPDALLVTAWHSPWPEVARSLDRSGLAAPVRFQANGAVDAAGWAVASGIAEHQVLDLGLVPNRSMPPLLREMDVALFPNRSEPGTNLVAMEAMACGVPTILSANTGHLDLIEPDNSFPLTRQTPLTGDEAGFGGVPGWGESDVDEIVATLEAAYADREAARARGLKGAETVSKLTWARTAAEMKAAILALA